MLLDLEPRAAILPIFKMLGNQVDFRGLLGTGFVVGSEIPWLLTAAHVFRDNPRAKEEEYGALFYNDGNLKIGIIGEPLFSSSHDVAAINLRGTQGLTPLPLLRKPISENLDVLTFEYSSTTVRRLDDGRLGAHFSPFTHKGNVLRHYESDFPEKVPTPVMDTSFPALQGASGAPVMRARDFGVTGMLVANHERHLLPAQVARIEHDEEVAEETRYFLPTGKALASSVIVTFLEEQNIAYDEVA